MVSQELKKYRAVSFLSQAELAELLNVSRSAVAKWEQQKGFPSKTSLDDISKLLNMSKEELLKEENNSLVIENIIKDTKRTKVILSSIFLVIVIFLIVALIIKSKDGIIDKVISPNKEITLTVYNYKSGYKVEVRGTHKGTWIKDDCTYNGLYWSPDSRFVVEAYITNETGKHWLEMSDFENNSGHNLQSFLVSALALHYDIDYLGKTLCDFQFLDWSNEANFMLIKYNLEYQEQKVVGYFWATPYDLKVSGITEINQ